MTEESAGWSYTVSVRALCEFTAKRGDLDRRFTPSATATEGLQGQGLVASRRGVDYETEVSLQSQCGPLLVRGRADGYDPRRRCLEEVKTIRGHADELPDNRRQLHWAQLETYGALFCRERQVAEMVLALVYFDIASQTETELRQVFGAQELEAQFQRRCELFVAWAQQEANHRSARDAALSQLPFPPGEFRPGQRELAQAVYRVSAHGRCLLAQAPTGIGKTVGTLYPLLRAVPGQGIDKVAYLTCKGTGRITALETLSALRDSAEGKALRVLTLVAKEQACEVPDKACHGDACPLARGFYDRLPLARAQAVQQAWLDAPDVRRIAAQHRICPYYLSQELVSWVDVLVGDVNHLFDARALLWGLMQAQDWTLAVLVDEAHNLVERARQMYSSELTVEQIRAAAAMAPAALRKPLGALLLATQDLVAGAGQAYSVLPAAPDDWAQSLQTAADALGEHFHQQPLAVGALLNFHFELQHLVRLADGLGEHSLLELHQGDALVSPGDGPGGTVAAVAIRNVVPAVYLRPRLKAAHSVTLFSATLAPPSYAINLLGLPEDTAWVDVPPAFAPEHLRVQVAEGLSTRFAHRAATLDALVSIVATQFSAHPGNYLAFFSSFDYLEQAANRLAALHPELPQWRQDRRMALAARQNFLARFEPQGQGVGFAVLGGVFAEGVDLPGSLLIGAFVATLGLPPVTPAQTQMQARLNKLFGEDQGYADLVPAMQKVVQAAGRVLRTPQDRGWLWLLDERYRRPGVRALLPPWWKMD